jgi:hypothetical protein
MKEHSLLFWGDNFHIQGFDKEITYARKRIVFRKRLQHESNSPPHARTHSLLQRPIAVEDALLFTWNASIHNPKQEE